VNERQTLFDVFDADNNDQISDAELTAALTSHTAIAQPLTKVEELVAVLNVGGSPPPFGANSAAILGLDEVVGRLKESFKTAIVTPHTKSNLERIMDADADGDGKFDLPGYEVNTGGDPVYLTMGSPLIRAQGFLELKILDNIFSPAASPLNLDRRRP
jgi:hypothetical protein